MAFLFKAFLVVFLLLVSGERREGGMMLVGRGGKVNVGGMNPTRIQILPDPSYPDKHTDTEYARGAEQSCGECQPVEYFDLW